MDTINGSFTIQINGEPVTSVEENGEPQIHASVGSEPAVFTLTDGLLEFGEWRLGRLHIEDRSLSPKRVNWFKKGTIPPDMIQPSDAEPVGDSYDLTLGGM